MIWLSKIKKGFFMGKKFVILIFLLFVSCHMIIGLEKRIYPVKMQISARTMRIVMMVRTAQVTSVTQELEPV